MRGPREPARSPQLSPEIELQEPANTAEATDISRPPKACTTGLVDCSGGACPRDPRRGQAWLLHVLALLAVS